MPLNTRHANKLTDYKSGGGSKSKSSFRQRLGSINDLLTANYAKIADENAVCDYATLRDQLADEFVASFGMLPDGAKKVAGDNIGLHGLQLRKLDEKGVSVVPLRLAAERVAKALEVLEALPANTKNKNALVAVLRALGLPTPEERKQAKQKKDQEGEDAAGAVAAAV